MTTEELVQRYLSDVHSAREAFEGDKIDRFELDRIVERLDDNLFGSFGFLPALEVVNVVDRIGAYSN